MISMSGLRKSGSRKCDTCNRNPVKRELDKEPGHWAWNSFRPYLHGEAGPVRVDDWTVRDRIDFLPSCRRRIPTSRKNGETWGTRPLGPGSVIHETTRRKNPDEWSTRRPGCRGSRISIDCVLSFCYSRAHLYVNVFRDATSTHVIRPRPCNLLIR
jgi:hypothetical protein